ncbi:MAG: transposase [Bdellovibrionales bacterium]
MSDHLFFIHHAFQFQIHSFVLMSNHYHMLVTAPECNISRGVQHFMQETSRSVGQEAGRINPIWGGRFNRCEIKNHHYFLNAYKYVYRNPVRSQLCAQVEEYPFSTLHGTLGYTPLYIPLVEDVTLFSDPIGTLNWLNHASKTENSEAMRKALRRKIFSLPKIDSRAHPLEYDLL